MVEGRKKTRSLRRLRARVPAGRIVTHYARKKPGKAICGACGSTLKGVARGIPNYMHNISKSHKRPQRPYGGVLCSRCARQVIINKYRKFFSLSSK